MKKIAFIFIGLAGLFTLFLFIYIRTLDMSSIRTMVQEQIESKIDGQVKIGGLSISGLKDVVVKDIELSQNGKISIILESLSLNLSLSDLIQSKLSFSSIKLLGLQIHARKVGKSYNLSKLLKDKKKASFNSKKTLSMVSGTKEIPLQIESIIIESGKFYLEDTHILAFEANGDLRNNKLNLPIVKLLKDDSYIESKLFFDLSNKSGVLQFGKSLIKLNKLASIADLDKKISSGKLEISGNIKFKEDEIEPQLVFKLDGLSLVQNTLQLKFNPIEILIQKDKIYSNIVARGEGLNIDASINLVKKSGVYHFLNSELSVKYIASSKSSNTGQINLDSFINGSLTNPNFSIKAKGTKLSSKRISESYDFFGSIIGNLNSAKLESWKLKGNKGSNLELSASLHNKLQDGKMVLKGNLADLSVLNPKLKGKLEYKGQFTLSNKSLLPSSLQMSLKDLLFDKQKIPQVRAALSVHTNQQTLVIKKSPIFIEGSNGKFILDARVPLNGDTTKIVAQIKAKSIIFNHELLNSPMKIHDLYLSSDGGKLIINNLLAYLGKAKIKLSGVVNPQNSTEKMFKGSLEIKSLNFLKISSKLPNITIKSLTLDSNNKFSLNATSNLQNFLLTGLLSADTKSILTSLKAKGSLDLSVFNNIVKKEGYKGVSGIVSFDSMGQKPSKNILVNLKGTFLSLPVSKDFQNLVINTLDTKFTYNPYSEILSFSHYNLSAFDGLIKGKGSILLNSEKSSNLSCKLTGFDLDSFLSWVSKDLKGHFFSSVNGSIDSFSFNPKKTDINNISFASNLNLTKIKYIYHQSVLDSIKGIESSIGPKSIRKYIKKKRDGFNKKENHFILFKDITSLKVSMKKSLLSVLPFQLIHMKDKYNFSTQSPLTVYLKEDKMKSLVSGQLFYDFSNTFVKEKFSFLKSSYNKNLTGHILLEGEASLPVQAKEQSRIQKDVAKKLAKAIDLSFLGKKFESGVRKLKDSKEIKKKINDAKDKLLNRFKSGKAKDLLNGLFGSKNGTKADEKKDVKQQFKDKKKELKNLFKSFF
ncbi:MAG: hypothetical protein COB02_13480 [Candidatus Cloacimonadota bacterium]|nr:MAG: hypothetical protein COB02_13480 [Candidatus Cloacimonadota bacterium]